MDKLTKKQKIEMLEIANAFLKAEIAELEKSGNEMAIIIADLRADLKIRGK